MLTVLRLQDGYEQDHYYRDYHGAGVAHRCSHLQQVQMSVHVQ
jgi:hypothetical protein